MAYDNAIINVDLDYMSEYINNLTAINLSSMYSQLTMFHTNQSENLIIDH